MRTAWCVLLFLSTCILFCSRLQAQSDSTILDKHFKFQDGIYYTFAELQQNQPRITWGQIRAGLYSNPQTYITRVDFLKAVVGDSLLTIAPDSIYGFSLGGIPYLYVGRSEDNRFALFAGLQVRGHLCYFAFEKTEEVTYDMPVYNPLTGQPFRTGKVNREEKIMVERLLVFPTGEIHDFTMENFKQLIADDPELIRALEVLSPEEAFEKLWKCMLIYDDRHPVFVVETVDGRRGTADD